MAIKLEELKTVKFSTLVEEVIEDVNHLKEIDIKIDMDFYFKSNGHCSVCLGGAAVLGFIKDDEEMKNIIKFSYNPNLGYGELQAAISRISPPQYWSDLQSVARIFDKLRFKDPYDACDWYKALVKPSEREILSLRGVLSNWCNKYPNSFMSSLNEVQIETLLSELTELLTMLKEREL